MTTQCSALPASRASLSTSPVRYISAERLYEILADRLGCLRVAGHPRLGSFWVSPTGRRFKVLDPAGRFAVTADGRKQQLFSLAYVRALLERLMPAKPLPVPSPEVMHAEPGVEAYTVLKFRKPGAAFDIRV